MREAEQALIASLRRVYEARGAVLRREVALTGARDDLLPPPPSLTPASRSRPGAPAFRFSGTRWSVSDAAAVREFYAQRFGRSLPVTAYGQTPTHRQMRFDHRNAIDVAVHPDSPEGKALTEYLRRSGIPHVAFRGRVAGASTGAHIHIGPPSQRRAAD
ncbi:MAG TPA: hypothetical protein VNN77_09135 [candidate division Zixibacteria bacterium]|nr:hypothetical protein [candidate division Zixibacteria bacterium]